MYTGTTLEGWRMQNKQRFDKVLDLLEQELQSVDKDLRQLIVAADYLGAMLPTRRRGRGRRRRHRCAPLRRL